MGNNISGIRNTDVKFDTYAPLLLLGAMKDEPEVKEKLKEHGIDEGSVDIATGAALERFQVFLEGDMEIYMYIFYDENNDENVFMMSINDEFYYTASESTSHIESIRNIVSSVLKILGYDINIIEDKPEGLPEDYKDVISDLETLFISEVD